MGLWLIILSAMAGGMVILHTFSTAKAVSEQLLDVYQDMLEDAHRLQREKEEEEEGESENDIPK